MTTSHAWQDWVRQSIGYKDPMITAAYYERFCRGSVKAVFQFLQLHLKSDEETRAIKENIAISDRLKDLQCNDTATNWQQRTSSVLQRIHEAEERIQILKTARAKRAIQIFTRLIDAHEEVLDVYTSSYLLSHLTKRTDSNTLSDYQRRLVLLRTVISYGETELKSIKENLNKLESYVTSVLSKWDKSKTNLNGITCNGCKRTNTLQSMDQLCDALNRKQVTSTNLETKKLIAHHTADCILNAFLKVDVPKRKAIKEGAADQCTNFMQLLQCEYVTKIERNSCSFVEFERLEISLDRAIRDLIEHSMRKFAVSDITGRECLSKWIKAEITIAGLRAVVIYLEAYEKHRRPDVSRKWEGQQARLRNHIMQMDQKSAALDAVATKIRDRFLDSQGVLGELTGINSKCQELLRRFIDNYASLFFMTARLKQWNAINEQFSNCLNSFKTVGIVQTREMIQNGDESFNFESNTASRIKANGHKDLIKDVLDNLSGSFYEAYGVLPLIKEMLTKKDRYTHRIGEHLAPKLQSFDGLVSELQSHMNCAYLAFNHWAIVKAEKEQNEQGTSDASQVTNHSSKT